MLDERYYIGQKFGRLTIKKFVERKKSNLYYECECECGGTKTTTLQSLRSGLTQSCGCLQKEKASEFVNSARVDGTNIFNLRRGVQSNNTSGVKGVYYDRAKGKYEAYITFKGKKTKLGYFDNIEDAAQARKIAEDKLHKEFLEEYDEQN